jgi:hypothetical protein
MRTADGRVQLQSRQQRPLTNAFPDIVELLAERLPPGTAVDGELVVMTGPRIDFQALQRRLASRRVELPATLVTFTSLATTARISGHWLTSAEAIVGGVLGSLRAPHALVLGRHDQRGRLRVTGRTFPLRPEASAAIAAAARRSIRSARLEPVEPTPGRAHPGRGDRGGHSVRSRPVPARSEVPANTGGVASDGPFVIVE